jgi:hypothetical protein
VTGQPFWEIFNQMLANAEAAQARLQHETWDDPLANKDVSRTKRNESDFSRLPPELDRTNTKRLRAKKSWLSRLLG